MNFSFKTVRPPPLHSCGWGYFGMLRDDPCCRLIPIKDVDMGRVWNSYKCHSQHTTTLCGLLSEWSSLPGLNVTKRSLKYHLKDAPCIHLVVWRCGSKRVSMCDSGKHRAWEREGGGGGNNKMGMKV